MTFGLTTLIDLLSWTVVLTLGLKLIATIILLPLGKAYWDRPGLGAVLWWASKITPLIAVPCLIAIAAIQHDRDLLLIASGLMVFVVVAVPLKILLRRRRIEGGKTIAA